MNIRPAFAASFSIRYSLSLLVPFPWALPPLIAAARIAEGRSSAARNSNSRSKSSCAAVDMRSLQVIESCDTYPGSYLKLLKIPLGAESPDGLLAERTYCCVIGSSAYRLIQGYAIVQSLRLSCSQAETGLLRLLLGDEKLCIACGTQLVLPLNRA